LKTYVRDVFNTLASCHRVGVLSVVGFVFCATKSLLILLHIAFQLIISWFQAIAEFESHF